MTAGASRETTQEGPGAVGRAESLERLLLFLVVFTLLFSDMRYLGSGDSVPAELLPISLLGEGDLDFDEFVRPEDPLPYWFRQVDGRIVSGYPILPGLLNVPAYALARLLGQPLEPSLSLVTSSLLVAFSALFLHRALRTMRLSRPGALAWAGIYVVATEVWSVAGKGLFQHGPSLFFLTAALALLLRDRPGPTAAAGLALGLAVMNRPTNLMIALPLAFFVLRHRKAGRWGFAALAAVPGLLHMLYASAYLGGPFATGYMGVGPEQFRGDPLVGLAGLLVSPSRGLFVFTPILLFGIPAAVASFRKGEPPFFRYAAVAILLVLALCARWGVWWGGHSFGYRILIETVPLWMLLLARHGAELLRKVAARVVFGALLLWSIGVQYLGVAGFPNSFNWEIDREPERLWDVKDSQLPVALRRLRGRPERPLDARGGLADHLWLGRLPAPGVRWTGTRDERVAGFVDFPREETFVRGDLVVSGWAGSAEGVVDVQVLLNPGERILPVERTDRSDVCRVVPGLRECDRLGFRATLARRTPGRLEECVVVVELRDPRGRVRRLPIVRFFWPN